MGPATEMMVNDFDDERTLDEEEALEGSEDSHNELSNLQKVPSPPRSQSSLDPKLTILLFPGGRHAAEGSNSHVLSRSVYRKL